MYLKLSHGGSRKVCCLQHLYDENFFRWIDVLGSDLIQWLLGIGSINTHLGFENILEHMMQFAPFVGNNFHFCMIMLGFTLLDKCWTAFVP